MTFSIVARCPRTGEIGVGALTAMVGVGKIACHARSGAGAISSQASMNPYHAYDGLPLLDAGRSAQETLDMVLAVDPGAEFRQVGVVDRRGRVAVHSGARTLDWSGDRVGEGYALQGNRLVGPETLEEAAAAFEAHPELDLVERILRALEAGEATGADREGALSGSVLVHGQEAYPLWDLRADHARDPAAELRRLHDELGELLAPAISKLPTREDPLGQMVREQLG
ncbi:DUF1028 domain-containing protein [Candidatus Blastococcus massiliensis]|uniref:DUF1028 domain-containing protein n=1 Tax=Candidatus Blastococcus massiliensis TaxID=1470358 RepID=UPI00058B3E27|nr:DUF1028 domain-containing protein [Candidatus Blastococcus massiliensis]